MNTKLDWHASPAAEVLSALETDADGLPNGEAVRRLQAFGPNRLRPPTVVSARRVLADQFKSIVVYLLVAAAVLSNSVGFWL